MSKMLSEPTYDPAKYVMVQPSDDADWYEKSSVATKDALKEGTDRLVQFIGEPVASDR